MKRFFLIAFALILILPVAHLSGQDCNMYFISEEGAEMELTHYNPKDKVESVTRHVIKEKNHINGAVVYTVQHTTYDGKDKEIGSGEFEIKCKDGVFYMDMKNFLDESMMQGNEDMEFEMKSEDLEFPSDLSVGQSLSDGSITATMEGGGMMSFEMKVKITDRKVETKETVTTPAGTFDCYRISYNTQTDMMMMNVNTRSVDWVAEDVGMVKSETYNKKDKLQSYTLLTDLKK